MKEMLEKNSYGFAVATPYTVMARIYNELFDSASYQQHRGRIVEDLLMRLGFPRDSFVLDAGCGTGLIALELRKKGWHVDGSDGSKEMINRAKMAAERRREELIGKGTFWQDDLRTFTVGNSRDVILCLNDPLQYLLTANDRQIALKRFFEALNRKEC